MTTKWNVSSTVTHRRDCELCNLRYAFDVGIETSSTTSEEEAAKAHEMKLAAALENGAYGHIVKCPGCKKMPSWMWTSTLMSSVIVLVIGAALSGVGILICWFILKVLEDSGLFFWGALLFVGFWTGVAIIGTPIATVVTFFVQKKGYFIPIPEGQDEGVAVNL